MNIGIDYLGYYLKQNPLTGEVELFAPAKKKWEFIQEVKHFEQNGIPDPVSHHPLGFPSLDKACHSTIANLNSRLGFLRHSKSYYFMKKVLNQLDLQFKNSEGMPTDFYEPEKRLQIRRRFQSIKLR